MELLVRRGGGRRVPEASGGNYLSNATCIIRIHSVYVSSVVSRITRLC